MSIEGQDEITAPGPGLPAFVHRLRPGGWLFVGLAVLLAAIRFDTAGFLSSGRPWSIDDAWTLVGIAGSSALVLAPAVLLLRRPAAWSNDRLLAIAAVLVACGPLLAQVDRLVIPQVLDWLGEGDLVAPGWTMAQLGITVPVWLLALATPQFVVWGLDRLDDRPPVRLPRNRVALVLAAVGLLLGVAPAAVIITMTTDPGGGFDDWTLVASLVVSGVIAGAWLWACLAAWSGTRARRGPWWPWLLVAALLTQLLPTLYFALMAPISELSVGIPSPDVSLGVLRIEGLAIAAGNVALLAALAIVPRRPAV